MATKPRTAAVADTTSCAPRAPDTSLLLSGLEETERQLLAPLFTLVALEEEQVLYEVGEHIEHIYFPRCGAVSLTRTQDGRVVEVGTVGREGIVGSSVLLLSPISTSRTLVQFEGDAQRMRTADLLEVLTHNAPVERLLLRYVHAFYDEVSQSVVCNRLHTLEERCARWLLITHDRLGVDVLPIKQRFLAYMLGVHRPAATLAVTNLQRLRLISTTRGQITIRDRKGLEAASCGCYAATRDTYSDARGGGERSGKVSYQASVQLRTKLDT
ncbi:MAG: Crp/Fnr family transcriptional regulator [Gemmatimonadaceae bacterium]